ncbi:Rpn family recombination-promoting nuclease/putative transposase [Beggiatoa alba]|uniref:Rpn family recombination-promoting nuclease/putative transposase n=1 Tax=Beggiatoa alba TaxID=1022 RepID=UPI0009DA932E|nr:Rpn family recombination-promoting nuclease/putative transposase [Beggiatoa alba]
MFRRTRVELSNHFEKWVYFLKNLSTLDVIPEILNEPVFQKAFHTAEIVNLKPRQAKQYQQSLLDYWSNQAVIETARKEGHYEGLAEGELKAKLAIAEQLKQQGMSLAIILQITGLSEADLHNAHYPAR